MLTTALCGPSFPKFLRRSDPDGHLLDRWQRSEDVYQHIAMACSPITTDALHSTHFSTLSAGIRWRYGSFPTSAPSKYTIIRRRELIARPASTFMIVTPRKPNLLETSALCRTLLQCCTQLHACACHARGIQSRLCQPLKPEVAYGGIRLALCHVSIRVARRAILHSACCSAICRSLSRPHLGVLLLSSWAHNHIPEVDEDVLQH